MAPQPWYSTHMENPFVPTEHPIFEYSQINDQVYLGTNACCQMHFKQELLDKGVTVDISLEGEMLDQPYGVESYLWLPVLDHTPPTSDQVRIGIPTLDAALAAGKKVYIHCKNGHGRGPTFYAAYLVSNGMTPADAIGSISQKRPEIHLEPSQISFLDTVASDVGHSTP